MTWTGTPIEWTFPSTQISDTRRSCQSCFFWSKRSGSLPAPRHAMPATSAWATRLPWCRCPRLRTCSEILPLGRGQHHALAIRINHKLVLVGLSHAQLISSCFASPSRASSVMVGGWTRFQPSKLSRNGCLGFCSFFRLSVFLFYFMMLLLVFLSSLCLLFTASHVYRFFGVRLSRRLLFVFRPSVCFCTIFLSFPCSCLPYSAFPCFSFQFCFNNFTVSRLHNQCAAKPEVQEKHTESR